MIQPDLSTRYLGLDLRSPLVASAAPHTLDPEMVARLDGHGVGAVVLPSLFEDDVLHEQHALEASMTQGTEAYAEALGYFPRMRSVPDAVGRYCHALGQVKAATSVPVIASLNARSLDGWEWLACALADAGADALELNLYHVAATAGLAARDVEQADLDAVARVRSAVSIPVAVKLAPYYTALAGFVSGLVEAGIDGVVLFNRFYQPDLDLDAMEAVPRIELSTPAELRLPVRWIALLREQVPAHLSFAASSGVHTGTDAVKALAVGADVAMMTSALLRNGLSHAEIVKAELVGWLRDHEYESVAQLRGSVRAGASPNQTAFERSNYVATLRSWVTPPSLTPTVPRW